MKHLPSIALVMALTASSAQASVAVPITTVPTQPAIWETVTQAANGNYDYSFGLPAWAYGDLKVTEIDLPWFSDAGLTVQIQAPTGWQVLIKDSPFNDVAGSHTLALIAPEGGLSADTSSGSFSFSSVYAPVKSPYAVQYTLGTYWGDPYIPGSPEAIASGLLPAPLNAVPEPEVANMLMLGMGLLGLVATRKKAAARSPQISA